MNKFLVCLFSFCLISNVVNAQSTALNKAKYVTTLKVITEHKMDDADLIKDINRLREYANFKKELVSMINKLDNSKPNSAKNKKVMAILEQAGKDIYNELK